MSVIFLLLTVSTLVASVFLAGFIWAVRRGQYDDDRSPAVRILLDDRVRSTPGTAQPAGEVPAPTVPLAGAKDLTVAGPIPPSAQSVAP
jgi:cbb3-type cytochrome oxidase maturation protein